MNFLGSCLSIIAEANRIVLWGWPLEVGNNLFHSSTSSIILLMVVVSRALNFNGLLVSLLLVISLLVDFYLQPWMCSPRFLGVSLYEVFAYHFSFFNDPPLSPNFDFWENYKCVDGSFVEETLINSFDEGRIETKSPGLPPDKKCLSMPLVESLVVEPFWHELP